MNTLINLSMNLENLLEFREKQSTALDIRLQIFKKDAITKYGSYDDIKTDEIIPLQSRNDIDLINNLVDAKDFVMIPVYSVDGIIQVYTIGLWYYWGLPELVFDFNKPVKDNNDFVHIFINIIKLQLYSNYHNKIVIDSKTIDRNIFNYDTLPEEIPLNLINYDVEFLMKKMDDIDYLNKNTTYLFWFYAYYMDIKINSNNESVLYPLYKIEVSDINYLHIQNKVSTLMTNDSDLSSIDSENE